MNLLRLSTVAILSLCIAAACAQNAPTSQSIQNRKARQQARIAQGVRSGQLTPHETAHLERREASINREERHMRRADNGHLTPADKAALAHRQSRVSRAIYRDKHNGAVR